MKRYFLSDKEITESEAREIEKQNAEILQRGDMYEMLNIKFIFCIDDNKAEVLN